MNIVKLLPEGCSAEDVEVIYATSDDELDFNYVDDSGNRYHVYNDRAVRVFDQMETGDWFEVV